MGVLHPSGPPQWVTALCTQIEAKLQARMQLTRESGSRSHPARKPGVNWPSWQVGGVSQCRSPCSLPNTPAGGEQP